MNPCKRQNIGAYDQPYSGVGMEFAPLGIPSGETGIVLHETGFLAENRSWNFPNVYSPFWRVTYDYKAGHALRFGDRTVTLDPSLLYIIPNHQRFDCVGDPAVPTLWFAFSTNRNCDPLQEMPIAIPLDPVTRGFAEQFPRLFASEKPDKRDTIHRASMSFLIYLLGAKEICWQQDTPDHIARVVRLINESPHEKWTNPLMARHAAMSTDGFARSFRRWTGRTPAQYVSEIRTRSACRLLCDTHDTLDAIASRCGFSDRYHLSRVFRRLIGTSPARYRRQHHH
jgi:AraC family transcriptional regulator of arabinose operon